MTTINALSPSGTAPVSQQSVRPQERRGEESAAPFAKVEDKIEAGPAEPARGPEEVFAQFSAREAPTTPEAARLLALDVRQQLQGLTTGIASVRSGSVLELLRSNG